ncbi:MAG: TetR/AcrR family transcriptional regulator, partial [Clostridia bacterium]|nr:TetR/AcrR family transcriptional regulator [Clostridia bacterium]
CRLPNIRAILCGMKQEQHNLKEELILAGIREIEANGVRGFSLRRVAKACDVSCAAPYKHFADLNDFLLAIVRYINGQWHTHQQEILREFPDDPRRQLTEISVAYIRFLMDNPHFRSIVMLHESDMDAELLKEKSALSPLSAERIRAYCESVQMEESIAVRKTFVIRSIIYGAALMMDNGQLPVTEENMQNVRYLIDREFDLP